MTKIIKNKHLLLPALYALVAGVVVAGTGAVWVVRMLTSVSWGGAIVGSVLLLLLALVPAVSRIFRAYAAALHYHRAEYLYDLGNGSSADEARRGNEKRAKRAAAVWIKRRVTRGMFSIVPVVFCALLLAGNGLFVAVEVAMLVAIAVVAAVGVALYTFLHTARRYCYDKFGNIKT